MIDIGASILVTAAILGVTHGFEPDHAAGISALTSDADGWPHAAFVGGSFAAGHVVVVLAWVGLLAFLGRAAAAVPAAADTVGTLLPGAVLLLVAFLLLVTGSRRLRGLPAYPRLTEASHPLSRTLAVVHLHLHRHDHESKTDYLRTGVVGSLFALSPPVSMLAFVSAVFSTAGRSAIGGAVIVYAVAITAAMAFVGMGLGGLFSFARRRSHRARATVELTASIVVFGFAVHLFV